jgi:hypothetical protein
MSRLLLLQAPATTPAGACDEIPANISWRDQPIESLTRKQLIEAVTDSYRRINQLKDERDAALATVAQLWARVP